MTPFFPEVSPGHLYVPDSKVQGANMGPIWGRQDPGGPHVGPMNFFAIWDMLLVKWISSHLLILTFPVVV